MWWSGNTVRKLSIDDPLGKTLSCDRYITQTDAFAVHYGGGLCGLLFTPVFMNDGIVDWVNCDDQKAALVAAGQNVDNFVCQYDPFKKFAWNLVGLIAITLWSGVICALMFFALSKAGLLR